VDGGPWRAGRRSTEQRVPVRKNVAYADMRIAGRTGAVYTCSMFQAGGIVQTGRGQSVTEREREIMVHLAEGQSNMEIADRPGISVRRVAKHYQRLYAKLGMINRLGVFVAWGGTRP